MSKHNLTETMAYNSEEVREARIKEILTHCQVSGLNKIKTFHAIHDK